MFAIRMVSPARQNRMARAFGGVPAKATNMASKHEASASATGYLFQCRYALLAGLRATGDTPQLHISIEKFDDIAFDKAGVPSELIQTKHHVARTGSLTDASPDLWNTLLIWSKRAAQDVDAVFQTRFVLLTTGWAPDGSAASFLRLRDRDESKADQLLLKTASTSKSAANEAAYAIYKALPEQV